MMPVSALGLPSHQDLSATGAQHLDMCVVKLRQRRGRNDLIWRTKQYLASSDVDHALEVGQDRVHIMCNEQYRHAFHLTGGANQRRNRLLCWQIEPIQWLIQKQDARARGEGLSN